MLSLRPAYAPLPAKASLAYKVALRNTAAGTRSERRPARHILADKCICQTSMREQNIIDSVEICQLPLIRQRFPQHPQLFTDCPRCDLGIACLPLVPQITDIMISIAPQSIRILFCKCYRRIIGLDVQIQIELLAPVVRNVHQADCPVRFYFFH